MLDSTTNPPTNWKCDSLALVLSKVTLKYLLSLVFFYAQKSELKALKCVIHEKSKGGCFHPSTLLILKELGQLCTDFPQNVNTKIEIKSVD